MLPEKLREIVEDTRFTNELKTLIPDARRAEEFIDGAKWVLSRDPSSGKRISTSKIWFLSLEEIPGILPVILYYTFDDNYVNLLSIQETIYSPNE